MRAAVLLLTIIAWITPAYGQDYAQVLACRDVKSEARQALDRLNKKQAEIPNTHAKISEDLLRDLGRLNDELVAAVKRQVETCEATPVH